MEIDIITYTDKQYAALTEEQILQVKEAQLDKNRLTAKLQENLQKEKERLVENGTLLSDMWPLIQTKLRAEYEQEVEAVRDALLFYLRFSTKVEETEATDAPYEVDYSLEYPDRYYAVRDYYMNTYTNASERFNTFKADEVAPQYLGEYYRTLYDYLLEKV
jgi:hypothetical protein